MEFLEDGLSSQLAAILESGSDTDSEKEEEDEEEEGTEEALLQEEEEAKEKQLAEFEQASQALLVELSTLEEQYEIEKSCREQAEAYATQLNMENQRMKRISVALLPVLGHLPGDLGNGDEITTEPGLDPVSQYLQQIKDLQAKVFRLLDEKKELTMQVKEVQNHAQQLSEQLEEERSENQSLQAVLEKNRKDLRRLKQVSLLVTEEYGEVSRQLDLEQELRQQAEAFAHQMLVKQKVANRQSIILMQKVGPDLQLLQALEEVAKTTRALEEAKQEHQAKVKDLETQLAERPLLGELHDLQAALAKAEEEKACLGERLLQTEERNAALEERVKSLEEKAKASDLEAADLGPVAPPPPPPLPPPPTSWAPVDPLLAIRQRKAACQAKCDPCLGTDDMKSKAMEEMMARIKGGVVLRPARRDAGGLSKVQTASKRRSTAMELQGLLGTMKKPGRRASRRKGSQKRTDNQLESILQRRRQMVDCPALQQQQQQQPPATARAPGPATPDRGAKTGAQPAPEAEPLRNPPPPSTQCSVGPRGSLPA
ncbi:shootin-1-like [Hemicordylus capensis]|uniref:shootin-1-like n=1 Tax=Hemicordylus capensis TaxID=884348 RepID=UPI0023041FBE|nr:shootin-1-like [Hemicordylus capensis]